MAIGKLAVRSFAQIDQAEIEFGDLTVLVGPQGAGKSLLLQLWKLALDAGEVVGALRNAGFPLEDEGELLDAYFGEGMRSAWSAETLVEANGKKLEPKRVIRSAQEKVGRVFYVPAHRALLLSEGWPAPFMRLKADTPTVARLFSQSLYERFTSKESGSLFPVEHRLKKGLRELLDRAVFHGGVVRLQKAGLQTRLEMSHGATNLPYMTWTAGQRELTPLLLGLYRTLPAGRSRKDPDIDWVIIEEPEMGLHPEALVAVMALVLDLLWRGYRVALSTHSPLVLDVVWSMRNLRDAKGGPALLRNAFGLGPGSRFDEVARAALEKQSRVFFLEIDETNRVRSRDISSLDPGAGDRATAEWGGLTGFSSRFGHAVAEAAGELP